MRAIDADNLIKLVMDATILSDGFKNIFVSIVAGQPTIHPESHWIPVMEQPPEVWKSVLICDAYGDICLGHRTSNGYYFPDFCEDKIKDVRAWCELPEPYKEKE